MDRQRVMNKRFDVVVFEEGAQLITLAMANNELMEYMNTIFRLVRELDTLVGE
jgi:hypothetical protein